MPVPDQIVANVIEIQFRHGTAIARSWVVKTSCATPLWTLRFVNYSDFVQRDAEGVAQLNTVERFQRTKSQVTPDLGWRCFAVANNLPQATIWNAFSVFMQLAILSPGILNGVGRWSFVVTVDVSWGAPFHGDAGFVVKPSWDCGRLTIDGSTQRSPAFLICRAS